jgi:hypothetical protein
MVSFWNRGYLLHLLIPPFLGRGVPSRTVARRTFPWATDPTSFFPIPSLIAFTTLVFPSFLSDDVLSVGQPLIPAHRSSHPPHLSLCRLPPCLPRYACATLASISLSITFNIFVVAVEESIVPFTANTLAWQSKRRSRVAHPRLADASMYTPTTRVSRHGGNIQWPTFPRFWDNSTELVAFHAAVRTGESIHSPSQANEFPMI